MFFDIHTHNNKSNNNSEKIINIFPSNSKEILNDFIYSIGVHPCNIIREKLDKELKIVKTLAEKKNIAAIGEIGFDKQSKTPLDLQAYAFSQQLKIARELNKPVIIHCVRCYSELLKFRKSYPELNWIIHGFRGKPELAKQLINKNIYISFGQSAMISSPSIYRTIKTTPLNLIFLETDESTTSIKDIYKKVSEIKEINIDSLINAINLNRIKVFENLNKE